MMRLLALSVAVTVALVIAACGDTRTSPSTTSSSSAEGSDTAAAYQAKADADKDNDIGAPYDDKNNDRALNFGHEAHEPEKRIIAALVKNYYAIALAGNGAKACSMIYSPLAESAAEDYGSSKPPGPPYMKGTTCTAVLDGLFRHFHAQLTAEVPLLKVTRVRLIEHHGTAILSFGTMPEREILVIREGHVWRMDALLDRELP